jgi:hypothetical protein
VTKMVAFMSGPWGRALRIFGGIGLIALALTEGGWGLLIAIPGAMMLITGAINYCPATLFAPVAPDRSEFMESLGPRNLLK